MKARATSWIAMAWPASCAVPNRPIRSMEARNNPVSAKTVRPIGTPIRKTSRNSGQSARQMRPRMW